VATGAPSSHNRTVPHPRRDRLGRPAPPGAPDDAALPVEAFSGSAAEAFEAGVRRFDEGRFFEAHELFEYVWRSREVEPSDRPFWKGVTQVAVGYCHVQRGNARGALALLARAVRNLESFPPRHRGVDARALAEGARAIARDVGARGAAIPELAFPAFPRAGPVTPP
jgi:uncharacterized protein